MVESVRVRLPCTAMEWMKTRCRPFRQTKCRTMGCPPRKEAGPVQFKCTSVVSPISRTHFELPSQRGSAKKMPSLQLSNVGSPARSTTFAVGMIGVFACQRFAKCTLLACVVICSRGPWIRQRSAHGQIPCSPAWKLSTTAGVVVHNFQRWVGERTVRIDVVAEEAPSHHRCREELQRLFTGYVEEIDVQSVSP